VIEKVRAVVPPFRDILGTSTVDVDGVAIRLDYFGGGEHNFGVASAELDDEGTVARWLQVVETESVVFPKFATISVHRRKHFSVNHGGVADIGAVSSTQETKWEVGRIDHRSENQSPVGKNIVYETTIDGRDGRGRGGGGSGETHEASKPLVVLGSGMFVGLAQTFFVCRRSGRGWHRHAIFKIIPCVLQYTGNIICN